MPVYFQGCAPLDDDNLLERLLPVFSYPDATEIILLIYMRILDSPWPLALEFGLINSLFVLPAISTQIYF
jgi:hypothetical protein